MRSIRKDSILENREAALPGEPQVISCEAGVLLRHVLISVKHHNVPLCMPWGVDHFNGLILVGQLPRATAFKLDFTFTADKLKLSLSHNSTKLERRQYTYLMSFLEQSPKNNREPPVQFMCQSY